MLFLKYIFIIFFLFIFKINANEVSKVRYIDVDFIFKNSNVGKKINKTAIENRNKKIESNKKNEKKLEDQKNDILAKQNILSKDEFEQKVLSHQKEVQEYQIKKNKDIKEMNQKNIDLTRKFMKKIDKILLEYASTNKIDLVLKKEILVISNSNLDITKNILEIVNKQIKKID
tara:strand:+ start:17 stop:535 length:519 start_codon:yes stop_codon:yes gene_type:complete